MNSLNATLYEIVLRIEKNDQMSVIYYLECITNTASSKKK